MVWLTVTRLWYYHLKLRKEQPEEPWFQQKQPFVPLALA